MWWKTADNGNTLYIVTCYTIKYNGIFFVGIYFIDFRRWLREQPFNISKVTPIQIEENRYICNHKVFELWFLIGAIHWKKLLKINWINFWSFVVKVIWGYSVKCLTLPQKKAIQVVITADKQFRIKEKNILEKMANKKTIKANEYTANSRKKQVLINFFSIFF